MLVDDKQAREKAPKRIYLQDGDDDDGWEPLDGYDGITWCADWINANDTEYIRADIHKAEVESLSAQVAELQKENSLFRETHARDCVTMTHYVPSFGRLSEAIDLLGAQVAELKKDAERRTVLNRTDGSVRCGLEPCCGRPDCENYLNARDAAKESGDE